MYLTVGIMLAGFCIGIMYSRVSKVDFWLHILSCPFRSGNLSLECKKRDRLLFIPKKPWR